MQEQVNDKTVTLVINGSKLTGRMLQRALSKLLRDLQKKVQTHKPAKSHRGKQTVKQLMKQGASVTNTELADSGIKDFERIARKYGVDFALKKDVSVEPTKWMVFFKGRDEAAIMAAIKEHLSKTVTKGAKKPSLLDGLRKNLEVIRNQVRDITKNKNRGREL